MFMIAYMKENGVDMQPQRVTLIILNMGCYLLFGYNTTHLYLRYNLTTQSSLCRWSLCAILATRILMSVCNQCTFYWQEAGTHVRRMLNSMWFLKCYIIKSLCSSTLFLSKYHIIHKISSFLSHDRLSEANLFFFFLVSTLYFSPFKYLQNTFKGSCQIPSSEYRKWNWIQKKRIYYLRILRHKTFFRIMVIETLVEVEQYRLRNRVAFISLCLLSRWLKWMCKTAHLYS